MSRRVGEEEDDLSGHLGLFKNFSRAAFFDLHVYKRVALSGLAG